jgi:alpha-pyrone synthase
MAVAVDANVLIICGTVLLGVLIFGKLLSLLPPVINFFTPYFDALVLFSSKPKKETKRYPYMMGLATGNPKYRVSQKDAVKVALKAPGCEGIRNVLERIYSNTRITNRYMAIPDYTPEQRDPKDEFFFPDNSYSVPVQERLVKFKETAVPLVTEVAKKAIAEAGISLEEIGKLVVVSSTGFLGPSLDCELIVTLGLPRSVDRALIGFMGCAAAMNGYRSAMDFVLAHPDKKALLVCVEISSVHGTFKDSVNDAVIHAIFGDGCAATVIAADTLDKLPVGTLAIVQDHAWLMEGTEDGIQLSINDDGISCTLSKYLPQYISKNMGKFVDGLLAKENLTRSDVDFWAIHPGGRRIIEEAQNGLGVTESQAADSWYILDNYGNMLSPTVMFVLERIFKRHKESIARGENGVKLGLAFSFSPGVGAEGIMLKRVK